MTYKGEFPMFCQNCGSKIDENTKFCASCGAQISASAAQQQIAAETGHAGAEANELQSDSATPQPGMKWYHFLIYFGLFAGALLNLINGIVQILGWHYGADRDLVYNFYDNGLKSVDVIVGILTIFLAIFGIVTRFRLSGYRRGGPGCLMALYLFNIIISLGYIIAASTVTGISVSELGGTSMIATLIVSVFMIAVNAVYFKKRSALFVK